MSAGTGSKGPRLFAWARVELTPPEVDGWQRWLLVRRGREEGIKPAEMAYVLVFAPVGTALGDMVEAFGARWMVEQCLGETKGEVGLDEYEVRSWHGWFRHVTLSMMALVFLAALRALGEETAQKKTLSRQSNQRRLKLPTPFKPRSLPIFG